MRSLNKYAFLLVALTMSASAQSADPLDFAARFERTPAIPAQNGQPAVPEKVFLKWDSVPGYRDVLESTTDLHTWAPLFPPLCGYGQTWSVYVPDAGTSSATGTGTPMPQYSFSQRRYSDGTILLTWNIGDLVFRKKFAPASDWATLAWPGAISYRKTDPEPPLVPYRVLIMTLSAHPLATPASFADTPNLTPDAQNRLDRLLALHDELETHIANTPPPPDPEEIGTASDGQRAVYRVRREMLDADDDLLNDCQEYTWGFTDENNPDSDGDLTLDTSEDFDSDSTSNLEELAYATDLVNGSSLHQPGAHYYFDNNVFSNCIYFHCWQDIRKPYRYQVEESTDLLTWSQVNHYTRLLPQFTQSGPVPGMDILCVKANYLPSTLPVPFLRVRATRAWPPYHLKHPPGPVRQADWKAHNNAHVDALIPDNEFGRNIYDEYNPYTSCKWAKWCWTNQLDWTGVSFSDGNHNPNGVGHHHQTGTYYRWECYSEVVMVTPVHGIFAAHWTTDLPVWNPGNPSFGLVVFHDAQGNRIVRKIIGRFPEIQQQALYDIGVVRLDSPVPPGIKVYRMFEIMTSPTSPGTDLAGAKVILASREVQAFPYQVAWHDTATARYESPAGTTPFYQFQNRGAGVNRVIGGDSGGPVFMFYKGEPVLFGILNGPGSSNPPPPGGIAGNGRILADPGVRSAVQDRINSLGGGYTIQTIPLDP